MIQESLQTLNSLLFWEKRKSTALTFRGLFASEWFSVELGLCVTSLHPWPLREEDFFVTSHNWAQLNEDWRRDETVPTPAT